MLFSLNHLTKTCIKTLTCFAPAKPNIQKTACIYQLTHHIWLDIDMSFTKKYWFRSNEVVKYNDCVRTFNFCDNVRLVLI